MYRIISIKKCRITDVTDVRIEKRMPGGTKEETKHYMKMRTAVSDITRHANDHFYVSLGRILTHCQRQAEANRISTKARSALQMITDILTRFEHNKLGYNCERLWKYRKTLNEIDVAFEPIDPMFTMQNLILAAEKFTFADAFYTTQQKTSGK